MPEESVLYKFEAEITYWDGSPHYYFNSQCTLTNRRLIIQDRQGKTQQTLLSDIVGVGPRRGLFSGQGVDVKIGTRAALQVMCKTKDRKYELLRELNVAVSSQFSYETQQNPTGDVAGGGAPYGAPMMPAQPAGGNGFAAVSLITGILPLPLFGLIFGFLGLSRAKKVGTGKAMAWIGIALSILWIGGIAIITPALIDTGKKVVKAADPGCVAATKLSTDASAKLQADGANIGALKTDLQGFVTGLNNASAQSNNSAAKASIAKLSGDFQELLNDLNTGTVPSSDLQTRAQTDATAVDTACGHN